MACINFPSVRLPGSVSIANYRKTARLMATSSCSQSVRERRKLPVLLFDVMDTIVRDPFYRDVPSFFKMSLKELLDIKHPTGWIEFEKGLIDEKEFTGKFFKDGRPFDLQGLKDCMRNGYCYIDGIEPLLQKLKQSGYDLHTFTNYPHWYMLIEEKLKLSKYLTWTFCSCTTGMRKPEAESFAFVPQTLGVEAADCIFIDDRLTNVEAAKNAGMIGIHFKHAQALEEDLSKHGVTTKET